MRQVVRLTLMALFGVASSAAAQRPPLEGLDAQIAAMLKDWNTPGLTLAVVNRDSVLHAKGYGVREYGKPDPVDANSLFSIGSCSKAFTSALVVGLIADGKLGFEDRAIDHIPWFRLWDPWVTNQVTVRDLMAHRIGADLFIENRLWPFARDMKDLVLRGGRQQPAVGFRERYRYSNNMFVAAGLVAEAVTGQPWATLVRERVFVPLGMGSTNSSIREALATVNRATPHGLAKDVPVPLRWEDVPDSIIGPTGGVNSTARDMARWLRLHLGRGTVDGKTLIPAALFDELHTPHTPVRGGPVEAAYWFAHVDAADLQTRDWSYALGWFVTHYRNHPLVWHGGSINGFRCAIAFLPEEGVGMYVGVNRITLLPPAMMFTVLDRFIGEPRRDWNRIFLREAELQAKDAREAVARREAARVQGTSPSQPASRYAGRYEEPAIGAALVEANGNALTVRVGPLLGELEHWHYDTFRVRWNGRGQGATYATFMLDGGGAPERLRIEGLGDFVHK